MTTFILVLIILGAMLMITNIIRYCFFLHSIRDVLSSGRKRDRVWQLLALVLLIFFLIGYLFVGFISKADVMTAFILFFGSIFVAIVETLMFNLIQTAKERSIDIAEILVGVIDARDPNLNGHSRYVQALTMVFYRHLPWQMQRDINPVSLEYAALMHDVGKMGVPEAILNKPASLDDEEWTIIRSHPQVALRIMKPLHTFDDVADWILYHHERIDGKGYYGLKGDEIPLAARIIAIADTYSAITMRRAYKPPRTHEEAVAIIREVAGTQLDQQLADIFLSIPKEELIGCMPEQVKY